MIVMPSNNCGFDAGRLFERYPGRLAHLQNPKDRKEPKPDTLWALDNGVFGAWSKNPDPDTWDPDPFYRYLEDFALWQPLWVVVPDWVADRETTLRRWEEHAPAVQAHGVPLAFACQDGMTPEDVPAEAQVLFIGGSTAWKWRSLPMWCEHFDRVHVGRVNTEALLWQAHDAGAESCDGTGWFRGSARQLAGLHAYLEKSSNGGNPQQQLDLP